jgi:Sulfotransferase family
MITLSEILRNSEELQDPIFVVGCMRSGTGMLARTIGLADSVSYVGETKLIAKYYTRSVPITSAIQHWRNGEALLPILKGKARRIQDQISGKDLLREIITGMIRYTKLTGYDIKPSIPLVDRYGIEITPSDIAVLDKLCEKYKKTKPKEIDRLLRILLKDFQLLSQKGRILEKTPSHALYIPVIQRIFPDAKICHILRDGKGVASSYMLHYGEQNLKKRSIRYICRMHRYIWAIDKQIRKANNPRYYSLRYEDFLASPTTTVEGVFNFLNLPLSGSVQASLRDVRPGPSNWDRLPRETRMYVNALLEAES